MYLQDNHHEKLVLWAYMRRDYQKLKSLIMIPIRKHKWNANQTFFTQVMKGNV